jgi:hypothetical protein
MSYSKGGRHAHAKGGRKLHVALRCCWKWKMLLSIHAKASRKKGRWLTMNLVVMIEAIKAQLPK